MEVRGAVTEPLPSEDWAVSGLSTQEDKREAFIRDMGCVPPEKRRADRLAVSVGIQDLRASKDAQIHLGPCIPTVASRLGMRLEASNNN